MDEHNVQHKHKRSRTEAEPEPEPEPDPVATVNHVCEGIDTNALTKDQLAEIERTLNASWKKVHSAYLRSR